MSPKSREKIENKLIQRQFEPRKQFLKSRQIRKILKKKKWKIHKTKFEFPPKSVNSFKWKLSNFSPYCENVEVKKLKRLQNLASFKKPEISRQEQ